MTALIKSVLALLLACSPLYAATNTAVDVSLASVTTAYNLCNDGDTLLIPAGNALWTSELTVEKALFIIGAGTNSTFITNAGNAHCFNVAPTQNRPVRISGISFVMTAYGGSILYSTLYFGNGSAEGSTNSHFRALRVDHCYFENGYDNIIIQAAMGWGVVDHNHFHNPDFAIQFVGGGWENMWPIEAGTTNALVFEDNLITKNSIREVNETIGSGNGGQRIAVRFNRWEFTGDALGVATWVMDLHGKGETLACNSISNFGTKRASPCWEFYMNTIVQDVSATKDYGIRSRGGMGLCWSNTATGKLGVNPFSLTMDGSQIDTTWPVADQGENTFFWANTYNGTLLTSMGEGENPDLYEQDRDYFLHQPQAIGARMVWPNCWGMHDGYMTNDVSQLYFNAAANPAIGYIPLTYPHPLATAQDGGDQPSQGASTARANVANIGTLRIVP